MDANRRAALQSYNRYNFDMINADEQQLTDYRLDESVIMPKVKPQRQSGQPSEPTAATSSQVPYLTFEDPNNCVVASPKGN